MPDPLRKARSTTQLSASVTNLVVRVTLMPTSDDEQDACLRAVQAQLDPSATMRNGIITCTISPTKAQAHQRKREARRLVAKTIAAMRNPSVATSSTRSRSSNQRPVKRNLRITLGALAIQS